MSKFLKPHSDEWFKILEKQSPQQAAQTRKLISLAASKDVCSICGDEESKDYTLEGGQAAPDTAISLRLCDDYLQIRKSVHGENLVPFSH